MTTSGTFCSQTCLFIASRNWAAAFSLYVLESANCNRPISYSPPHFDRNMQQIHTQNQSACTRCLLPTALLEHWSQVYRGQTTFVSLPNNWFVLRKQIRWNSLRTEFRWESSFHRTISDPVLMLFHSLTLSLSRSLSFLLSCSLALLHYCSFQDRSKEVFRKQVLRIQIISHLWFNISIMSNLIRLTKFASKGLRELWETNCTP